RIDDGTPPGCLGRKSRIGAGRAAQEARARGASARIGARERAQTADRGSSRNRLEVGKIPAEAGQVAVQAQFASEDRIGEGVLVVYHRVNHRQLVLVVCRREAIEIKRSRIEVTSVSTTLEIGLGYDVIGR